MQKNIPVPLMRSNQKTVTVAKILEEHELTDLERCKANSPPKEKVRLP